ncbi:hypothetical protein AN958_07071 [Leucoagaricus sp. SymC.cos]|nr:hypothetical protein AN958_07071 [Leucoagaricus sp. SymC.cos]
MVLHAPVDEGRRIVASEIMRCQTDQGHMDEGSILALAEYYKDHLLRCFLSNKGRTPAPRSHPSAPSFDLRKESISPLLTPTPKSHAEAKTIALRRDNYCCVISGKVDSSSIESGLASEVPGVPMTVARAAHIFDRSTNQDLNNDYKRNYAASVHAVLERFGGFKSVDELTGEKIHSLKNILTLSSDIHEWFDQLKIWLEQKPDDPEHCYCICARDNYYLVGLPRKIHLSTSDPERYPLPDPRKLAIHAACAQVIHLSGAAEHLEKILQELEMTQVLETDGRSAHILHYALVRRIDIEAS